MNKTLVTGATGFIGLHLTRRLVEQGDAVRCLVRKTSQTEALRELDVELVEGNVLDASSVSAAMAGVDRVFHLAGCLSAFRKTDLMRVNGEGTATVADACAASTTPPILVYVSSIAAAGPTRLGQVKREQDEPCPISNYGRGKRAGEIAVERCADRVPITVVRPGVVFGEGSREMLPMFRAIDRLRVHAVAGMRSPPLSVIYVHDLVTLLERAAQQGRRLPQTNGTPGTGFYFACRDEYPDYAQFGRLMHQAIGRRRTFFLHVPQPLPWLIAGTSQMISRIRGQSNSFNIDKIREATVESWACSCAAAQADLDFAPSQSLLEQLRATTQWYRQAGWL